MGQHMKKDVQDAINSKAILISKSVMKDMKIDGMWIRSTFIAGRQVFSKSAIVINGIRSRCKVAKSFQTRFPHYAGSTICQEWEKDFPAFADWYTAQTGYELGWQVDKDLSGSRCYSPSTCILLPREVNLALADKNLTPEVVFSPLKDGIPRWRTQDGFISFSEAEAKAHRKQRKLEHVATLEAKYLPLGLSNKVFTHLRSRINSW